MERECSELKKIKKLIIGGGGGGRLLGTQEQVPNLFLKLLF